MKEIIIQDNSTENKKVWETFYYERKAHYYETDQMGIVHHSNYIRWMEEARIAFMDALGLSYHTVEERGVLIPVLSASCEYKNFVRFDEIVEIYPRVKTFNGIRLTMEYRMLEKGTGKLCCVGETGHCFTTAQMKPLSLKKQDKEMYDIFMRCFEHEE